MEFGVNTKFVLGLPRAKQLGLEHCQKKIRTVTPPLSGMIMITVSMVILIDGFPNQVAALNI